LAWYHPLRSYLRYFEILPLKMNELRAAIIRAHENGKGVREIARFLDIEPSIVSRTIKRFEETGSNKNRKREKTARTLWITLCGAF
jgi:DNA-binding MarR family transcriptional regulator